jgi:hypothetical protein
MTTGTKVNGKHGEGIITKIITKSTGYVEVTYNSGIVKKEMAFNLTDENGNLIKKMREQKPLTQEQAEKRNRAHARFIADMNMAVLKDNFFDFQIESGNYNKNLIR